MTRLTACAIGLAALVGSGAAYGQSMNPMRGEIGSFTDQFAVRVFPSNPYKHRIRMEVRVYDQDFRPVRARVAPSEFSVGAGDSRPVLVVVPFEGATTRKVRICTESVPFPGQQTQIRAQICGKFLGRRRS